jgi:cation:H+ antiporter
MLFTLALFLLSAAAIYVSCEYFVNGIEWLGHRLNLGATAVGSVLAAFGTALPESAVTFVAVVLGKTPAEKDLGVGAALGGPLVLATIAYAVVGIALLVRGDGRLQLSTAARRHLSRDQAAFLAVFAIKVGLGLVVLAYKPLLGTLFLAVYALYVWQEMRRDEAVLDDEDLEPLKIRPKDGDPAMGWAALQVVLALLAISIASHVFVAQLQAIGDALAWPPQLVALLLSPVATELPETMNAVIWMRQGKERLALANISGAMMVQATIPSALGIFFTPWQFDHALLLSGVMTAAAITYLWRLFRRGRHITGGWLAGAAIFYGAFALLEL